MLYSIVSNNVRILLRHYVLGEKAFKLMIELVPVWGIYEGQCDQEGNACGEGRWVCKEHKEGKTGGQLYGTVFGGRFREDKGHGLGM